MANIEQLIRELRVDLNKDSAESLKQLETRITKNINEHTDEKFGIIQDEIENLKKTSSEQDKRILELEKHIRYRNLIFFAVEEGETTYEELENKVLHIISKDMKVECNRKDLEMVRRMGRRDNDKVRPIVVTLTTYGKKISVLKNKHNLKEKNTYVKEDYPQKILENRKKLQEQLEKERNNGKIAYLRYDRLIVREPNPQEDRARVELVREPITQDGARVELIKSVSDQITKKRGLEITPPHQRSKQYTFNDQKETSHKFQAAKKTKVRKNKTQKVQYPMTSYFQKQIDDVPKYSTALSSDESDE